MFGLEWVKGKAFLPPNSECIRRFLNICALFQPVSRIDHWSIYGSYIWLCLGEKNGILLGLKIESIGMSFPALFFALQDNKVHHPHLETVFI